MDKEWIPFFVLAWTSGFTLVHSIVGPIAANAKQSSVLNTIDSNGLRAFISGFSGFLTILIPINHLIRWFLINGPLYYLGFYNNLLGN